MKDLLENLSPEAIGSLRRTAQPSWVSPMLAVLTEKRFSSEEWIYERKLDGERCLAFRQGNKLRLMSRNRKELNDTYPELAQPLLQLESDNFILDGEIVAFEGNQTSFSRLQARMQIRNQNEALRSAIEVFYYVFDRLYLDGYDVAGLELRHRKALLKSIFPAGKLEDTVRFTSYADTEGVAFFHEACKNGWEGVIAKRASSPYVFKRSSDWLKFKCGFEQELVIGGYTDPQRTRIGFGALLLEYYDADNLVFAGKVGTGFSDELLQKLGERLQSLEQSTQPFVNYGSSLKGVHWVNPVLVAQIGFTEWTPEGKLRHPRFLGLRNDKDAREVVLEKP